MSDYLVNRARERKAAVRREPVRQQAPGPAGVMPGMPTSTGPSA